MVRPVVDDLDAIDEQAHPVVAGRIEGVRPGHLRAHLARPPHAERIGGDAGDGCPRRPVEVHRGVQTRDHGTGEVRVVEVVALQAHAHGDGAADERGRVGRVRGRRGDGVRRRHLRRTTTGTCRSCLRWICGETTPSVRRMPTTLATEAGVATGWPSSVSWRPGGVVARVRVDDARDHVDEGPVGQAPRITHGQVDAIPDVGGRLPGVGDGEGTAGAAAGGGAGRDGCGCRGGSRSAR